MQSKVKQTSKKFYNKWLYKITLNLTGAALFRSMSLDDILEFCDKKDASEFHHYSFYYKAFYNKDNIKRITEFLKTVDSTIYSKRIESRIIDFYTNDQDFYNSFSQNFDDLITHRFEPDLTSIDKLNSEVILSKKYPHDKYRFRVYLLPHKLRGDKESKLRYINWIKSQNGKITCSDAVEKWFINTDWNWDRRYVLVEDEQTLLMLKLRDSNVMGRVYNYVLSDK